MNMMKKSFNLYLEENEEKKEKKFKRGEKGIGASLSKKTRGASWADMADFYMKRFRHLLKDPNKKFVQNSFRTSIWNSAKEYAKEKGIEDQEVINIARAEGTKESQELMMRMRIPTLKPRDIIDSVAEKINFKSSKKVYVGELPLAPRTKLQIVSGDVGKDNISAITNWMKEVKNISDKEIAQSSPEDILKAALGGILDGISGRIAVTVVSGLIQSEIGDEPENEEKGKEKGKVNLELKSMAKQFVDSVEETFASMGIEVGRNKTVSVSIKVAEFADKELERQGYGEEEELKALIGALKNVEIDSLNKARYMFSAYKKYDEKTRAVIKAMDTKRGFSNLGNFPKIENILNKVSDFTFTLISKDKTLLADINKKLIKLRELKDLFGLKSVRNKSKSKSSDSFRKFIKR